MQLYHEAPSNHSPPSVVSAQRLAVMVAQIACIIFVVEALVMFALYGFADRQMVIESMIDATLLTVVASPLIYIWVARPFAAEAAAARQKLAVQLEEARSLLDQNVRLKDSLQEFSAASADIHERTLQRIGAELHDGPAQSLTFSLLQVDRLLCALERTGATPIGDGATELRRVIFETAREVRGISTGLALPELRAMALCEVVELAVHRHKMTTGGQAAVKFETSAEASQSQKACIYRVIQESLSNATKHGKARSVTVSVTDAPLLTVTVTDDGGGFEPGDVINKGLGLLGMRARVEALRGNFGISSAPGRGTRVVASFETADVANGVAHG